MARNPIEIPIASETRAFKQGIDSGVIEPLEDAEKALEELGRARGPEQLEDSIRDAQRRTKDLADETKDTARVIEREFRDSYREAGRSAGEGFDRAKEGARELQSEIGSNLGEAVSSFRGDMQDLGQVGQDTLGGLAATVASAGPAGLAGAFALAAGAAGLGLFTAGQEEAKQKQEELNEAAANWASAYQGAASQIVDSAYIVAEINAIATDPERYQQAKDAAEEWGVSVPAAMAALAGDATSLATAEQSLKDRTEEANRQLADQERQVDGNAGAAYDLADSVKAGRDRMDELNGVMREGYDRAQQQAEALYIVAEASGTATGEVDDLGNKIVQMPDGKQVVIDAETQRAYEDIDAIERQDLTDKTVTVDADTSPARKKFAGLLSAITAGATIPVTLATSRPGRPFEG